MIGIKSVVSMAVALAMATVIGTAPAATISQDFESETLGSTTPPADWSLVSVAGPSSYVTATGNGGGLSGSVTGNHPSNGSTVPAGYAVNSGQIAFDASKPISGSFDFYVVEAGNYSSGLFMIGDVQSGIAQTDPGEYLAVLLRERTFGARAQLVAGDGSVLFDGNGNNLYRIETNEWESAEFTWTPTSGLTGDFSFSWTGSASPTNRGPMTAIGYTFDNPQAFFGFGSGGYFGGAHTLQLDNILIDGTALGGSAGGPVIPEPSTAALLGLAMLGLAGCAARRRA